MNRTKVLLGGLLLFALTQWGCGGGAGGSGDSFTSLDKTTGINITTQAEVVANAWKLIGGGSYPTASAEFRKVLDDKPSEVQRYDALAGLGFALTKNQNAQAGLPYFEQAWEKDNNAKAGYAGALIARGSKEDMDMVIHVLTAIEPNNANFRFEPRKETGVTNADLHAMLAYAYFFKGEYNKATSRIEFARAQNKTNSASVDAISKVIEDFL